MKFTNAKLLSRFKMAWVEKTTPGVKRMKITGPQLLALYDLKGTGLYVGKDARMKTRFMHPKDFALRTLLALRRRGLIEHSHCSEWYLTQVGREFVAQGRLS